MGGLPRILSLFPNEFDKFNNTVKAALSGHSKIDKTNALKTNGSLLKIERIAECSL